MTGIKTRTIRACGSFTCVNACSGASHGHTAPENDVYFPLLIFTCALNELAQHFALNGHSMFRIAVVTRYCSWLLFEYSLCLTNKECHRY